MSLNIKLHFLDTVEWSYPDNIEPLLQTASTTLGSKIINRFQAQVTPTLCFILHYIIIFIIITSSIQ